MPQQDPGGHGPAGADPAAVFDRERPYLLSVAYRLTGGWADAEDVVAQAWPRWARAAATVERPRAWLTRVVARLALDELRSARHRREQYVGPWLPEPLVTRPGGPAPAAGPDPLDVVVRDESVRLAFLVVLDTLPAEQRVAFVLHDVLDVPFREVAEVLGCTEPTARQHASRGRRRVAEADPAPRVLPAVAADLIGRLGAALATGDTAALAGLLAQDVVLTSDGAGEVSAARRPVVGIEAVARLLGGLARLGGPDTVLEPALVNGDPGILMRTTPRQPHHPARGVYAFTVRDGRIQAIYGVLAPAKLGTLDRSPG